jgi:hypothetical protein
MFWRETTALVTAAVNACAAAEGGTFEQAAEAFREDPNLLREWVEKVKQ